jgi:hypothetical protein
MTEISNYLQENGYEVSMFLPTKSKMLDKLNIVPKFNTIALPGVTDQTIQQTQDIMKDPNAKVTDILGLVSDIFTSLFNPNSNFLSSLKK